MAEGFDAVVVGAGPAGSAAALVLARAGRSVCLLERGPRPGAKNLFGGVVYGRVLDGLVPRWWEEAPVERFVTRRSTVLATPTQALSVDFRTQRWGEPPYNGVTAYRPAFDAWLAGKAVEAGATLVCETTATALLRDPRTGAVVGVATDRPDGDLAARVVVACDGVNSFLARSLGLAPPPDPHHYTLGVKEVLALPAAEIEARFGLGPGEGADVEILGCTGDVPGGGFLYTNRETVSVGVVLELPALARAGRRPERYVAELKAHPALAPLLRDAELVEYGAHLIPEAGVEMVPRLVADGFLVAGDAAGLCLAAGLWLEGVNFAVGSGAAAGETAVEALAAGDVGARRLASYRRRLEEGFVLQDLARLRGAPALVLSERVQRRYPALACSFVESLFTVSNPTPKPGMGALWRQARRSAGLRRRDLARDLLAAWRVFR